MKSAIRKIHFSLVAFLCLAAALFFFNRNIVTANYADDVTPSVTAESIKAETRCGWFSNPTPANAWLTDKDGEWLISAQGGYQAEGDWADFKPNQWVKTNVNYGYGCTCMNVTTDKKKRRILTIESAIARPLSACRKDKKLKEPK